MRYSAEDLKDWQIDILEGEAKKAGRHCTCRSTSIEPCDYCDGSMDCDKCGSPDCIGDCDE